MIAGTFLVSEILRPHPEHAPIRRPLEPLLNEVAQNAADTYEREGQPALNDYFQRVRRESDVRSFLFNDRIEELSGQRIPSEASNKVRAVFEGTHHSHGISSEGPPLTARAVTAQSGKQYVLVSEILTPIPRGGYHPILHLLGVGLVGALFCYWLARHLTSPVTTLRAATRELARGNLHARVSPAMGNRHDELAALGADFDLMAEKIQSLVESQRRLLGDISHELRSPLTRMNVALELARQRAGTDATTALERIQREAENLNELIGQLLTLTRLESGSEFVPASRFDLSKLVGEVVDDAEFEARGRNRGVTFTMVTQVSMVGTEHLLRRAIENVVRNAVQYTNEGTSVKVKLELIDNCPELTLTGTAKQIENPAPCAMITVRDYGPGVPREKLQEIFRPFYRVDEARDREAGGVGLGLAIVERAMKLHGGSVNAANALDGGLQVTMSLPLNPSATR